MEHTISNDLPVIVIDLAVGVVGFLLSLGWAKRTKMDVDRDTVRFLAMLWSGIALFGILLVFVM